jgi:hypothetical protein
MKRFMDNVDRFYFNIMFFAVVSDKKEQILLAHFLGKDSASHYNDDLYSTFDHVFRKHPMHSA